MKPTPLSLLATVVLLAVGRAGAGSGSRRISARPAGQRYLIAEGRLTRRALGQAYAPGGEAPLYSTDQFRAIWDTRDNRIRVDHAVDITEAGARHYDYSEFLGPDGGFIVGRDSDYAPPAGHALSPGRWALDYLDWSRVFPTGLPELHSARDGVPVGKRFASGPLSGGLERLPGSGSKIRKTVVRLNDELFGALDYAAEYDDYRATGGEHFPRRLRFTLDGAERMAITVASLRLVGAAPVPLLPEAVKDTPLPFTETTRTELVSTLYQLDGGEYSDWITPGHLHLLELAPGVYLLAGGTHNSLVVSQPDGLIVVDGPANHSQTEAFLAELARVLPGQPIRRLVVTHHHADHWLGLRLLAESRPDIYVPDYAEPELVKTLAALSLDTRSVHAVSGTITLGGGGTRVELRNVQPAKHAQGLLIPLLREQRIAYLADLWSPGRQYRRTVDSDDALRILTLCGAADGYRIAGGHGSVAPVSDLQSLARKPG